MMKHKMAGPAEIVARQRRDSNAVSAQVVLSVPVVAQPASSSYCV